MTDQQIRDALDKLQATLSAGLGGGFGRRGGATESGSLGAVSYFMQAKRETLPAVLDILRQVLREPTLPADEFEVLKRARLAAIERLRTEPSALASRLLQRTLSPFPTDDVRYVPTIDESIERIQNCRHEDVVRLHREYLGSHSGELAIVGDFDEAVCIPLFQAMMADWTASQSYARIAQPLPSSTSGGQHRINTPDKANAMYVSGLLLPVRDDDANYPALVIANFIFGGGTLSSRLGNRVRQQEGLSYGVGSSFAASPLDQRASWTTDAICNPQNIGKLERVIAEEIEKYVRDGVTATELEQAKQGYLQSQQVGRASEVRLAGMLTAASYAGRTLSFQAELEKKIAAVTPEQVNAVVRKYMVPANYVIVTAGDFEKR
jgi:zinc protease